MDRNMSEIDGQTLNVLIVEDEPGIALAERKAIESANHTATMAENGADALKILSKGGINVVLLDNQLPDTNGSDLLKIIVEQYRDIPVIMITGHGDELLVAEVMKRGAKDYLVKDYELNYLKSLPKTIEQFYHNSKLETKARQLQQQLVLSNERLELALDGGNIGLWDWNVLTGEIFVDKHWANILGYRVDEIEPHITSIQKMMHPDEIPLVIKGTKDLLEDHIDILNSEFRMKNKSGEWQWISAHCKVTRRDENEKPLHVSGTHNNITKRKNMEEALLQSEKLKSIGTITAGISHEFNNLLAIISGNVQILQETYKDSGVLTDTLRIIKIATNDGAEISDRMLKFTRTKKDTVGFVSCEVMSLIEQAIDFTKPRWKNMALAEGINYYMDKEDAKQVHCILCDPTEIREVFINIINNALHAMPDGGHISFRIWDREDTVFISVSDNGVGMSEDIKKNIFDPFFTTKPAVGTGLGMSTAYGIILRHGGNIKVESVVGKGSTFTLQFPVTRTNVRSIAHTETEQETNVRNLRILVVDDSENIRILMDKFLSESNHKVKTIDNGADAIELIKKEEFDLVLCDLAMPDVFGYDVIKVINNLGKRSKTGIITGWNDDLTPQVGEEPDVDFIIRKPFEFPELTNKINAAFGRVSRR